MHRAPVVTLASVIHSTFVRVEAVEHGEADGEAHLMLRLSAMNDPDVEDITLCITGKRAEEAGLLLH